MFSTPKPVKALEVFLSYADEDEPFGQELQNHLSNLPLISIYSNSDIKAGQESALNTASIILFLISPDFLASDYLNDFVVERAMKRQVAHEVVVVPIILRPCTWQEAPFSKFQILPKNGKAITMWGDREAAYNDIVQNIQTLASIITSDTKINETKYDRVRIFYSFAIEDEAMLKEIDAHLSILKRRGLITTWHDREILPGMETMKEIKEHLDAANIILLLVSPHFLTSDYCYGFEMQRALMRMYAGEARIIPIILSPCNWRGSPFDKLQVLPRDAKPITDYTDRRVVLTDIVNQIEIVVQDVYGQQHEISERKYTKTLLSLKAMLMIDPTGAMFQLDKQKELERIEHELEDIFEKRISEAKEQARIALQQKEQAYIALQKLQKEVSEVKEQTNVALQQKEQAEKVTQNIQKEVVDAKEQTTLANQNMNKAERTSNLYGGFIAILLSCLLVTLFELSIHWFKFTWILEHSNSFGLQVGFDILIIFIVFCVIGFIRFKQLSRRLTREELGFYLGIILPITTALIAILIGLFQLLGGPTPPH